LRFLPHRRLVRWLGKLVYPAQDHGPHLLPLAESVDQGPYRHLPHGEVGAGDRLALGEAREVVDLLYLAGWGAHGDAEGVLLHARFPDGPPRQAYLLDSFYSHIRHLPTAQICAVKLAPDTPYLAQTVALVDPTLYTFANATPTDAVSIVAWTVGTSANVAGYVQIY